MAGDPKVSEIRETGGDYNSLTDWQADFGANGGVTSPNLVANNEIAVAECYNDWGGNGLEEPSGVYISGWTTGEDNYVVIRPAPNEKHDGTPGTGFRVWRFGNTVFTVFDHYTRLEGIEIINTNDGNGFNIALNIDCREFIIDSVIGKAAYFVFQHDGDTLSQNSYFRNCIALPAGPVKPGVGFTGKSSGFSSVYMDNCVASGCAFGFVSEYLASTRENYVRNCVAYDCGTSYVNEFSLSSTNNAASDATTNTPPGSNPLIVDIVAGDFQNAALDDYHITTGSQLYQQGIDLSVNFTTDIDGDEWQVPWSIGVDEPVSGAPPTDINPVTEVVEITAPQVTVVFTPSLDIDVNPITEFVEITAPIVDVQVGLDIGVNPVTETVEIDTPPVTVEFVSFVNVQPVTVDVEITALPVQVVEFVDTRVDPITEVVVVQTPPVEVFVGLDLNITPATADVEVTSPKVVSITTPVEFLIATEAVPLQYQVSISGDVQMKSQGVVNAWRNEHGHVVNPFPAVISSQPVDLSVAPFDPIVLSVTAIGATAYQWYVDRGSGKEVLLGETAATLNTTAPGTPGTYLYSCVVLNGDDFGIRSKDGTVTVT